MLARTISSSLRPSLVASWSHSRHKILTTLWYASPDSNRYFAFLIIKQNWSRFWKTLTMLTATLTTFSQGFGPLALAPMMPQMEETFNRSLADIVQFTGVCILVLGFSNFLW